MLSRQDYIRESLELNLFFGRIMKEHMIFIEAGLLIIDSSLILEGDQLKKSFEILLLEAISLARGVVSKDVLKSEELITAFTLNSEIISQDNTGICINKDITLAELELESKPHFHFTPELESEVHNINQRAINLVREVIKYKEKILAKLEECKMFANLYRLLVDHIMREAKFYLMALENIQRRVKAPQDILEQEIFWDTIMKEHALFVRGLLEPTEVELFNMANDFSQRFGKVIERTKEANKKDIPRITKETLRLTTEIRDFKAAGTEGLIECQIKAMAYPLLGDHILREANRYIRVLNGFLNKY